MFRRLSEVFFLSLKATITCVDRWRMSDGGFIGGGVFAVPESAFSGHDTQITEFRDMIVQYMKNNGIQTERGGWLCCQANFPDQASGFQPELIWLARWLPINDGGGLILAKSAEGNVYEDAEEAKVYQ